VAETLGADVPVVLAIDASTAAASVAVLRAGASVPGVVLAERDAVMRAGATDALMPAVDAGLEAVGVRARDLTAVVCGAGPGGFTSLRIAAAVAKGLAHATGCALVAVPSLALSAATRAAAAGEGERAWLVTLDALRGERYAGEVVTERAGERVRVTGYRYLGVHAASAVTDAATIGDRTLVDANVTTPRAAAVQAFGLGLVDGVFGASTGGRGPLVLRPVDLDTWEPDYGRQAEAQARWESTHGRPLASALDPTPGA